MNFNPKAPPIYRPVSQKVATPPVYRPQQMKNSGVQPKSAGNFRLETRCAPAIYRPEQASQPLEPKSGNALTLKNRPAPHVFAPAIEKACFSSLADNPRQNMILAEPGGAKTILAKDTLQAHSPVYVRNLQRPAPPAETKVRAAGHGWELPSTTMAATRLSPPVTPILRRGAAMPSRPWVAQAQSRPPVGWISAGTIQRNQARKKADKERRQRARENKIEARQSERLRRAFEARAARRALGAETTSRRDTGRLLKKTAKGQELSKLLIGLPLPCLSKIVQLEQTFDFSRADGRIVYRKFGTWADALFDYSVFRTSGTSEYQARTKHGRIMVESRTYSDGAIIITVRHGARSSEKENVNGTIEIGGADWVLEFKYMKDPSRPQTHESEDREIAMEWSRPKPVVEAEEGLAGFTLFD